MLTIPQNERSGTCRINGEPAEFRIEAGFLSFKYAGADAWDRRRILAAMATRCPVADRPELGEVECIMYTCGEDE
jgi:hypothetical protein